MTTKQMPDWLRGLLDERDKTQKDRIAVENQLRAHAQGKDILPVPYLKILIRRLVSLREYEEDASDLIKNEVEDYEIFHLLKCVKGLGPILSAYLIAFIDPSKAPYVSSVWKYAGLGVTKSIDPETNLEIGKADRPTKGQKLPYNKRLKTKMHVIGLSLLKQGARSPYTPIYYHWKEIYLQRGEQQKLRGEKVTWTKARADLAALRKMNKVFLSHLILTWKILEGLPINRLYVHEVLEHKDVHYAHDFGWPNIGQHRLDGVPATESFKMPEKKVKRSKKAQLSLVLSDEERLILEDLRGNIIPEEDQVAIEAMEMGTFEDEGDGPELEKWYKPTKQDWKDRLESGYDELKDDAY